MRYSPGCEKQEEPSDSDAGSGPACAQSDRDSPDPPGAVRESPRNGSANRTESEHPGSKNTGSKGTERKEPGSKNTEPKGTEPKAPSEALHPDWLRRHQLTVSLRRWLRPAFSPLWRRHGTRAGGDPADTT